MSATLPTNWVPNHEPTAAELGQVLNAITRVTNIGTVRAQTTASLAGSTSATYVDVSGTSLTWSKTADSSGSDVLVCILLSCYVSIASTQATFGVALAGTDYDVMTMIINPAATHTVLAGFRTISGLGAGSLGPIVRFKRVGGTGTVTVDTGDTVSLLIMELPK